MKIKASCVWVCVASVILSVLETANADVYPDFDAGVDGFDVESVMPDVDAGVPLEPVGSDPALLRLREALGDLLNGKLRESSDIDGLFTVRLDDPTAIENRILRIPVELSQLNGRIRQIEEILAEPESLIPKVPRPPVLEESPIAPLHPGESPVEPDAPTAAEIRDYKRTRKSERGEDPMVRYQRALDAFRSEQAVYEGKLSEYTDAHERYLSDLAALDLAREAFNGARAKRRADIREQVLALEKEALDLKNRAAIASFRRTYLTRLLSVLKQLSGPGLEAFVSLSTPRNSLRKRSEVIGDLSRSASALLDRTRAFFRRVQAGALVGFQVQQDDILKNLDVEMGAYEKRLEKGRKLADALRELASSLESDARKQRRYILLTAAETERDAILDRAFQARLRESRRAARGGSGFAVTDTDLADLNQRLSALLLTPKSVATVSDGERILVEIRGAGDQLEQTLDGIRLGIERYRQAYQREIVTIYSSLASDEVKQRAYSFSYAFFDDFVADMNLLRVDFALYVEQRLDALATLSSRVGTVDGRLRMIRIFGGLILILALVLLRHRIRRRLARFILRLVNLNVFKQRAGLLVRLTMFLLALAPMVLAMISGYALLYLIGMDYAEVRIVEIGLRFGLFYLIGRQVVVGLTRKERSGRPALIDISQENYKRLRLTYARLGLFLALAGAADELSREWMGTGSLNTVVRLLASLWLGVWTVWAMAAWRRVAAESCMLHSEHRTIVHSVAAFSSAHRVGVFVTPLLMLWIVGRALGRGVRKILAEGNLLAYFRARALRRMSRKTKAPDSSIPPLALPKVYRDQFPLYPLLGEEGEVLLPRKTHLDQALKQIERWQSAKQDGSLVLVGEKGVGKTSFLALLEKNLKGMRCTRHIFAKKLNGEGALLRDMCRPLGREFNSVDDLAAHLNQMESQVILLDEAHNIFLRTVGGFKAVNALVSLVDATSNNVFWVMVFNGYSWAFLSKVNTHVQAFRKVLRLPAWSQAELKELVARRNERSGCEVVFDEVLLDAEKSSTGGFELISSADGFFRLLWEASRGNPRVATYLWLNALTPISKKRIKVGLIREADGDFLNELGTGMRLALASMAQHENLSFDELALALNVSKDEAVHAARYLIEYGLLEPKHTDAQRYTLSPAFHQQVLRTLKSHHLLYLEE